MSSITSIFPGIAGIYREATEAETMEFLNESFISLQEGFSSSDVKTANRKRIALAMDILSKFETREKESVFSYILEYYPESLTADGRFSIGSESDLKVLLYGIEQRYYTTPVGQEKRLANSVVKIGE